MVVRSFDFINICMAVSACQDFDIGGELNTWMTEAVNELIASDYPFFAPISRGIDCRDLHVDQKNRAQGHLGFHRWNMAAILMSPNLRKWRVKRYLELYCALFENSMLTNGSVAAWLYWCAKGCHRSVAWMSAESGILVALGFDVHAVHACRWYQMVQRCQRNNRACSDCDPHDPVNSRIRDFAVTEFFEVLLVADSNCSV